MPCGVIGNPAKREFEIFDILPCGVIGNTSDSGSEEFRFEP